MLSNVIVIFGDECLMTMSNDYDYWLIVKFVMKSLLKYNCLEVRTKTTMKLRFII